MFASGTDGEYLEHEGKKGVQHFQSSKVFSPRRRISGSSDETGSEMIPRLNRKQNEAITRVAGKLLIF